MSQTPNSPEQSIRAMQIIVCALLAGLLTFGGVVLFLVLGETIPPMGGQIVSLIGLGFAILMFVMHLSVPDRMARQVVQQMEFTNDELRCHAIYRSRLVIGMAMLEGAGFFNLIACMIEQHWWSLAVVGALMFWMLAAFPTTSRVDQWIETQRMNAGAENSYR